MILTNEEVEHIAHLARLRLTQEEVGLYREQLSAILEYAGRLQAVDTQGNFSYLKCIGFKKYLTPR